MSDGLPHNRDSRDRNSRDTVSNHDEVRQRFQKVVAGQVDDGPDTQPSRDFSPDSFLTQYRDNLQDYVQLLIDKINNPLSVQERSRVNERERHSETQTGPDFLAYVGHHFGQPGVQLTTTGAWFDNRWACANQSSSTPEVVSRDFLSNPTYIDVGNIEKMCPRVITQEDETNDTSPGIETFRLAIHRSLSTFRTLLGQETIEAGDMGERGVQRGSSLCPSLASSGIARRPTERKRQPREV